jgi:hypothetical protein
MDINIFKSNTFIQINVYNIINSIKQHNECLQKLNILGFKIVLYTKKARKLKLLSITNMSPDKENIIGPFYGP